MAHELFDAFTRAMQARSSARSPSSVQSAMTRFGWSTRDVARMFGVSDRTARRWRQLNAIPARRADEWRSTVRTAAAARTRARIEARGLSALTVEGIYRISRSRYKSGSWSPVRVMPGNRIRGAQMRDVFEAADRGDMDAAESQLSEALAEAYGTSGIEWESIDGLGFDIG